MDSDRLFKEHRSYVLEEEQQKIKLDKFVADGAEDWDIKNAVCARLNSDGFTKLNYDAETDARRVA